MSFDKPIKFNKSSIKFSNKFEEIQDDSNSRKTIKNTKIYGTKSNKDILIEIRENNSSKNCNEGNNFRSTSRETNFYENCFSPNSKMESINQRLNIDEICST